MELGDAGDLEELPVVFQVFCFGSASCFNTNSLRRFMACAVATLPIPLVASRSILSDAALALKSRRVSSAAGGTALDGMSSVVGPAAAAESGSVGSEEGSPVLRFLGPFLLVSSTVLACRSLELATVGFDTQTLEAVDISPEGVGALGSHMSVPMSADSVGSEEGSPVLRFIGPFLLGASTIVSGR